MHRQLSELHFLMTNNVLHKGLGRVILGVMHHIDDTFSDPALVEAIHRWFKAQISDHGEQATGH